jgi:hypothetical protein
VDKTKNREQRTIEEKISKDQGIAKETGRINNNKK